MDNNFYDAVLKRRSVYNLTDKMPVSDTRLLEIVQYAVKPAPSPFNMQSQRAVLLLGANHKKVWDITKETRRSIVPADKFAPTETKINSFAAGYGTVLYFTDSDTVAAMQTKFPSYKENFAIWAQQCMGMLQYIVWTALAAEGIGASLQHYNPLIDESVLKEFNLPRSWRLSAQMPFGIPSAAPDVKSFLPIEDRVKVFK